MIYEDYSIFGVMSTTTVYPENERIFERIHLISNRYRFQIMEITQKQSLSITELSSKLKLSYTKCADYVKLLEKARLVQKTRMGKEVHIHSRIKITSYKIDFIE